MANSTSPPAHPGSDKRYYGVYDTEVYTACRGDGRVVLERSAGDQVVFCGEVIAKSSGCLPARAPGVCIYRWSCMPRTAQARAMRWIDPLAATGSMARRRSVAPPRVTSYSREQALDHQERVASSHQNRGRQWGCRSYVPRPLANLRRETVA